MSDDRPTFGSLFAGIGGIDLGLERAGWECRFQVEWDPFCQRVLAKHWPDVPRYGDITAVDWSGVERVDLLAGGFPCQPISSAGRQEAQADPRWLWPQFHRAIRALRPSFVLVENVTNLLAVNAGTAFGDVLGDLASSGYDVEWDCIPAAAIGALHERDRVWIVAYANGGRQQGERFEEPRRIESARGRQPDGRSAVRELDYAKVADAWRERPSRPGQSVFALDPATAATREAVGPLDGRFAGQWSVEPDVGRVAHGVPARVDRLKALGNAVVPQVVEMIGTQLLASLRAAA